MIDVPILPGQGQTAHVLYIVNDNAVDVIHYPQGMRPADRRPIIMPCQDPWVSSGNLYNTRYAPF
ncbi:hypothetical protein MSKU15_0843 [Komagataeibacter diospyri]|nr:hypothetical protein MSKU15_0843 [Komagataeibacter diospyri]